MLWAGGWTLDQTLDLSWVQLSVVVNCVITYKAEQANMILSIVSGALGGKVKKPISKNSRSGKAKTPEAKEQQLMRGLASMGIPVSDV